MSEVIVGLDAASTSAHAHVVNTRTGVVLLDRNLPATVEGEDTLLAVLPERSMIVVESTGRYHLTWIRRLHAAGHEVYVLNGLLAKRLETAHTALRRPKTDKIDARRLAEIGRLHGGDLKRFRFTPDSPTRVRLRAFCTVRRSVRLALTNAIRTGQHLLGVMIPEADVMGLNLAYNQGLTELFLRVDSRQRLLRMRESTLAEYACSKAQALRTAIAAGRVPDALFDAMLPALQAQLRMIKELRAQLQAIEAEQRATLRSDPVESEAAQLAQSVPGCGPKTAATIVPCLPPGWREWGSKRVIANRLQAYWGFDPRPRESGKWKGQVRMTKRGIEIARTAMFQCAVCGMLHDPTLKAFYDEKRAQGMHHLVAVSHIMRKQLRRIVAVWYDRKPYTPASAPLPLAT